MHEQTRRIRNDRRIRDTERMRHRDDEMKADALAGKSMTEIADRFFLDENEAALQLEQLLTSAEKAELGLPTTYE